MTEAPRLTVSQVMGWNIDIESIAGKAEEIAKGVRAAATTMDSTIDGMTWSGAGRNGANYRSDRELQQMEVVAKEFDALADECRTRHANLASMVSTAITNVTTLSGPNRDGGKDSDRFLVGEDWTVTDNNNYQAAYQVAGDDQTLIDQIKQVQTDRAAEAAYQTVIMQRLANAIDAEDAATATAIGAVLDAIEQLTPAEATEGLTPSQAAQDGKAIADGTATPEEIARIASRLSEAGLTPEQLAKIDNGEQVNMSPATLAYLKAFYGYAGEDGLLGLTEQLDKDGSDQAQALKTSLANGLMTLSDEQVVATDGSGAVLMTGGWNALPAGVRDLVGTRREVGVPLPDANGAIPDKYRGKESQYASDVERFAGLLSSADTDYQPGDRLGVELSRLAAHETAIADHPYPIISNDAVSEDARANLLGAGARNEVSNHALITGNGPPELLGTEYHRDDVMVPLMSHDWDDDSSLRDMFSWIKEDAIVEQGQVPTEANTRAGEAAYGLAQLLSSTESADGTNLYARWMDMGAFGPDGHENLSFSQLNPEAARAMADALSPYVGNMVGEPGWLTNTDGFGNLGGPVEAVRALTVLSGDDAASAIINGAALAESHRLDQLYATEEANGTGNTDYGNFANRLTWTVDHAIDAEIAERVGDKQQEASDRTAKLNAAYTAAQIMVGGFGPAQAGVAALAEPVKLDLFPIEAGEVKPHEPLKFEEADYSRSTFGTTTHREYTILQALEQQGVIDFNDVPAEMKNGDRFKTWTEFKEAPVGDLRGGDSNTTQRVQDLLRGAGVDLTQLNKYTEAGQNGEDTILEQAVDSKGSFEGMSSDAVLADPRASADKDNKWPDLFTR
ncbi:MULTISPECIES: hypothetical protein [unclassified Nocardia]|uniref:TPR repeat region-containing protein n=1 Tax=unclassified Nocardia TaxID=2637762 RepID=UPI00278C70DA|nr:MULTISPECIES: hypothetical protein [unclassified Nocardia]